MPSKFQFCLLKQVTDPPVRIQCSDRPKDPAAQVSVAHKMESGCERSLGWFDAVCRSTSDICYAASRGELGTASDVKTPAA
jgi:hypothetical protein